MASVTHPVWTCPCPAPFWWEPLLGCRFLEERPKCGNGPLSEGTSQHHPAHLGLCPQGISLLPPKS